METAELAETAEKRLYIRDVRFLKGGVQFTTNVIQGAETSVFPIDSTRFHVGQTYRIGIVSPKSVLGFLVDVALVRRRYTVP